MAASNLTAERLREFLSYDPESGVFTWIKKPAYRTKLGSQAGTHSGGYVRIKLFGTLHPSHRLAWMYMTGHFPQLEIDHVNGIRDDNRFCNLRECSHSENLQNIGIRCNNKSGHQGVSWNSEKLKWQADIRLNGRTIYLGRFDTPEEASATYTSAKARIHAFQPTVRLSV